MTTWRKLIADELDGDKIIDCTLSDKELDLEFDNRMLKGANFTAWSLVWVYFPVMYDCYEWVGRVRRNPNDEPTKHMGG